jgi:hypothetical protein
MSAPSTWLDQVLAVPTIGLNWEPVLFGEHEYLKGMEPILADFSKEDGYAIQNLGIGNYRVTSGGFSLSATGTDLTVEYSYPTKLVPGPRAFLSIQAPAFQAYTALIQQVRGRMMKFAGALPFQQRSRLNRIGVVVNCRVERANPPPGLASFLSFLGSPWKTTPVHARVHLGADLRRETGSFDRCHHFVTTLEDDIVELKLDWQRWFEPPLDVRSSRDLETRIGSGVDEALAYFERFGKGDLNYAP